MDETLGTHEQEHVSAGQVVKALILNGMGFRMSPLYLFSQFAALGASHVCKSPARDELRTIGLAPLALKLGRDRRQLLAETLRMTSL